MATSGTERLSPDGRTVTVTVTPGAPQTGLWCPACQLPTLIRVPLYAVSEGGVTLLGTAEECHGCMEDARTGSICRACSRGACDQCEDPSCACEHPDS
jgi:hypothetical protein